MKLLYFSSKSCLGFVRVSFFLYLQIRQQRFKQLIQRRVQELVLNAGVVHKQGVAVIAKLIVVVIRKEFDLQTFLKRGFAQLAIACLRGQMQQKV